MDNFTEYEKMDLFSMLGIERPKQETDPIKEKKESAKGKAVKKPGKNMFPHIPFTADVMNL